MNTDFKWDHLQGLDRFIVDDSKITCHLPEAISARPENVIDPVAVLGVLMKNYPLGDRTMISGISKLPWMARWNHGKLICTEIPRHGKVSLTEPNIANKLIDLLKIEATTWLTGKKSIGLLLSGGMDSRIIASIVKQLQREGLYTGSVTALTWGIESSRDVIYSKRIADLYGWDFKHFPIDADTLLNNIVLAGERGAEYSPIHLHAMDKVAELTGIDGILAGSYGDSIGRGEYSGRKIDNIPDILKKHFNKYSFLRHSVEGTSLISVRNDLKQYRQRFPGREETAYREIEMQAHYMRRQLNSCMSIIDNRIPLYQMFSAPSVFGFMWSLSPLCRNDSIYENVLKQIDIDLLNIPWARDGKIYNKKNAVVQDNYSKMYHCYGSWLRNENREFVIDKILDGRLASLNIFNEKSLLHWSKNWRKDTRNKVDRLDEKMAWLASLSIFVEKYNIQGIDNSCQESFIDSLK